MKLFPMLTLLCALSAPGAESDWVTVGDPGNPPDKAGCGAVAADDSRQLWHPSMGLAEYRVTKPVFAGRVPPRMPGCIRRAGDRGGYRYEAVVGWEKNPWCM